MSTQLPPYKRQLKAATRALLDASGGQDAAALSCRVGQQTLSNYAHLQMPDSFMPLDVVADLEHALNTAPDAPVVTRTLVRLHGGAYVQLPRATAMRATAERLVGLLSVEHGQLVEQVGRALADNGRIDPGEINELGLIDQVRDIQEAAAALLWILEARASGS